MMRRGRSALRCTACDHENPDGNRFCGGCGVKLPTGCPACGHGNPEGNRFCGGCGASLETNAPTPAPTRAPRDYTPQHLAEKILSSQSALEGERKQVTVLFADVKGSMELAEQLDPEDWHRVLERFFEILTEGVHRFEGTVNQYTGDGIMALFGAPIAHEDHAERACYAALHIRDAVRAYANEVRARHGIPFGVRIGMNSGDVVVGKIGDDLRMDYTAQGHTVGLAQRMEALAESGHIVLSEHTAGRVEGFFALEDLGPTAIKGASGPVRVFDLEGVGRFRTRLDRSRSRGLSTFVGRDADMGILEAALERARSDGGQVVGVMAAAGTGKSRLCAEFIEGVRARGIPVLEGRGVAHGKSIPMLPMLEVWRGFYGIEEEDSAEAARAKIAGRLLLMDESFREELPILFDVFGVPDPENPSPAMDPEKRQKRIQGVVKRILHDPAYQGGRVVLLEDLHWFDGASDSFLEVFVESIPATRDLWLVNFRPEYEARWMQRSYYHHLALQPLDPEAIRSLLRDQLGEDASVAALPEAIHERTKGNPFFIEEVVQSLVESGDLVGARGDYRLTTTIEALPVPASVQAVLASRIDRLAEREKQVLQTAAVIGKTFAEALLARVASDVAGLGERDRDDALSALVAAEFLFEAELYPELEYSFKHPLTQEVAAGSQLSERRQRVHAAVARALEQGGSLDERAAEIAQHWAEGGDDGRAALWSRRAAEWAGLSDAREALHHWRRVREFAPRLDDAAERDELALAACHQILSLGWRMGDSEEEAAKVFADGRALVEKSGDRAALALLLGAYGLARFSVGGSGEDYARYAEEGATLARECSDPALRPAAGQYAAFGHWVAGNSARLLEWADQVLEDTGADNEIGKAFTGFSPRIGVLAVRTQGVAQLGRLEEAAQLERIAEREIEASGELEVWTWLLLFEAPRAFTAGMVDFTPEKARRGIEVADQLDNESSRFCAYGSLGVALLMAGDAGAARDALLEAIRISREARAQIAHLPRIIAFVSEASRRIGDHAEAEAAARNAIELAVSGGCRYFEVEARLTLARALRARGDTKAFEEVAAVLDRAETILDETGNGALVPHIAEERGRLAAQRGEADAAEACLRQAYAGYREVGAAGHAERIERELAT